MQISSITTYSISSSNEAKISKYRFFRELNCDTVAFGLKRNDFDGVDKFVLTQFKINPQQCKTNDDFQRTCQEKADEIWARDYNSMSKEEVTEDRKKILNKWKEYLHNQNTKYKSSGELLIADGLTQGLDAYTDSTPPVLYEHVLKETMDYIENNPDKVNEISFYSLYRNKLRAFVLNDVKNVGKDGKISDGWIVIPSKENDPENFKKNIEKLKALSHDTWCTRSYMAESYLANGDFHVYYEGGKPRLGVRFIGNKIVEIQGAKNTHTIPIKYLETVKKYINDNQFKNAGYVHQEFNKAASCIEKIDDIIQNKLHGKNPKECSAEEILSAMDISVQKDKKDGLYILSNYNEEICKGYTFADLGANMKEIYSILSNTKEIEGDADFSSSCITKLPNLRAIGGNADFSHSPVKDLSSLQFIGGGAEFRHSKIEKLPNLHSIGGSVYFYDSRVKELPNLKFIMGNASFNNSEIKDLSGLIVIKGNANFYNSMVRNLSGLRYIGGLANFCKSKVTDLSKLQIIGKSACFSGAQITKLPCLKYIGGEANFENSKVEDLSQLKFINGSACFINSPVKDLPVLETIGGWVYFNKARNPEKLKLLMKNNNEFQRSAGCFANSLEREDYICASSVKSLPKLQKCKGIVCGENIQNKNELIARGIPFISV